jgi:hypothetical protein
LAVGRQKKIHDLGVLLEPYVATMRAYVRGELELDKFETQFNALFLADDRPVSLTVFEDLDGFFIDVGQCVPPPDEPNREFLEITPDELRERAIALLREGGYEP